MHEARLYDPKSAVADFHEYDLHKVKLHDPKRAVGDFQDHMRDPQDVACDFQTQNDLNDNLLGAVRDFQGHKKEEI